MTTASKTVIYSAIAGGLLVSLLLWQPHGRIQSKSQEPLLVYCAAGSKVPVEAAARAYEKESGVMVQLQYGGSGMLLSNLRVAGRGDLFMPGDVSYLEMARSNGLVAETIPLASMNAVVAVAKGNPKNIRSLADLSRDDVRLALANPEAASIGKVVRDTLSPAGQWTALESHAKVFKPTVNDLANDLKIGQVDAAIVWDAVAALYPELEAVTLPELEHAQQNIAIGVLRSSKQPTAALRFARYLGASDRGLREFARADCKVVDGDVWAVVPEVVLYSGALNRVAVDDTIRRFEEREGVRVTRVYNGCGILVAQMKAGQHPDAYLACDVSFMNSVTNLFGPSVEISETDIVILTAKTNPKGINKLADLAQPGLRVGVANARQSTLGDLTEKLLQRAGLLETVMANAKTQTPTADLLVNQMRTGALDAVVVYAANTSKVRDSLEVVRLDQPGSIAVQPYAVGKNSGHRQLMERLRAAIQSDESRATYEALGFRWRGTNTANQ